MILVTVGTNEQPFDRLVEAAARLRSAEPLVVQHGSSAVEHGPGTWLDFVSFEDLSKLMAEARVVVSHAGVGSIMVARRWGHRPVVVPRRLHLGEAVDDHQLPLARRLQRSGTVTLVEDTSALAHAIAPRGPAARIVGAGTALPGAGELTYELRTVLTRLDVAASAARQLGAAR
jgi:UDP-N-acetylglucosamine transferase subunit ALG13